MKLCGAQVKLTFKIGHKHAKRYVKFNFAQRFSQYSFAKPFAILSAYPFHVEIAVVVYRGAAANWTPPAGSARAGPKFLPPGRVAQRVRFRNGLRAQRAH